MDLLKIHYCFQKAAKQLSIYPVSRTNLAFKNSPLLIYQLV